jgi:hypothetical protein
MIEFTSASVDLRNKSSPGSLRLSKQNKFWPHTFSDWGWPLLKLVVQSMIVTMTWKRYQRCKEGSMDTQLKLKECFDVVVRLGREIAEDEGALHQIEGRLRIGRAKLEVAIRELLSLLPANVNTARLGFALTACATGTAVLQDIVSQ